MKAKRLLSVLIAVCMLLSSMAMVSFAAEGEFTCSNVSFGYVTGEIWEDATGLEAGKDLTAKISVSKTGDKQSVIFTLIVYCGDRIFDVNTVTEEIGTDKTDLIAVVTLPGDVEDCYVSAFLWDNYVDANPICNISGFPDASVAVTGIYVDGAPVEKFDPATKTYDFAVEGDRTIMPEVTVTTLDLGAKVTITNPTRFPGSTVIKVTNGSGDENTYTVNYICAEGFVNSIDYTPNVYEAISEDVIIPSLYKNFNVGSKAFFDRDFLVTEVLDESYLGMNYIGAGLGWKNSPPYRDYYKKVNDDGGDWWTFSVARDAKVIIVAQAKIEGYTKLGFTCEEVPGLIKVAVNDSIYKFGSVHTKEYKKGSVITLPAALASTGYFVFFEFEGYTPSLVPGAVLTGIEIASKPEKLEYKLGDELDLTGLTVNAVHSNGVKVPVTDYDVEPCDMALGTNTVTVNYAGFTASFDVEVKGVTFGLSSLKVDGNAVADFDIATKEYDVVIPSTQVKFPVVDAVATEGGLVSVTNPTEFPGKATVKVTKTGEEDAVYTLNYVFDKEIVENVNILGDNMIPEAYGGGNVSAKPKYRRGGFVVGTPAYSDREERTEGGTRYTVLEINAPELVGGDYITGGITWYNGKTPTVSAFTSADTLDWLQFTLNRDATVYVLKHHNNDKEKFESYGYTQSISDNAHGYMYTLLNGTNHRYHKYMYSKKVTAGTKVIVPNSTDDNNTYHTVITYDGYEELIPEIPAEPTLSGIEITSEPSKLTYTEGEELDLTGLKVKANYSDNSSEEIDSYTVSECDMSVGKHTITVTYEGYTATFEITVEALPEEIFGLTALTVDGTAVKNVSSAVYEYNVTIPANQKEIPLVEATVSEGATYEVTEPEAFPGSVTLTVSADGKEDVEYTITYVTDKDIVSDIEYNAEATASVNNPKVPYLMTDLKAGNTAFYDRDGVNDSRVFPIAAVNDETLLGKDYFGVGMWWNNTRTYSDYYLAKDENGNVLLIEDWWHFTLNRDATVYIVTQGPGSEQAAQLEADGWTKDADASNSKIDVNITSANKIYNYKVKYTKAFSAGEVVTFPNIKTQAYFAVIDYDGYTE